MTLPGFVDRKTLADEMSLPRSAVDAIFRTLPVTRFPGCPRKVFVKRADVIELVERGTCHPDGRTVALNNASGRASAQTLPGPAPGGDPDAPQP